MTTKDIYVDKGVAFSAQLDTLASNGEHETEAAIEQLEWSYKNCRYHCAGKVELAEQLRQLAGEFPYFQMDGWNLLLSDRPFEEEEEEDITAEFSVFVQ